MSTNHLIVDSAGDALAIDVSGDDLTLSTIISLTISPSSARIYQGQSQQFTATYLADDGTSGPASCAWGAYRNVIGQFTGLYPGASDGGDTVTAFGGGQSPPLPTGEGVIATASIVVIPITRLAITPSPCGLKPSGTQQFTCRAYFADGTNAIVEPAWSALLGTISATGLYTADATGLDTICASYFGVVAYAGLQVAEVFVLPPYLAILQGQTHQFHAHEITGSGGFASMSPAWSSQLVQISSTGLYTANLPGPDVVTATDPASPALKGFAIVEVVPLLSIAIVAKAPACRPGGTIAFSAIGTWADGTVAAITPAWTSTIGSINASGRFSGSAAAAGFVTALYLGVSATVPVAVLSTVLTTPAGPVTFTEIGQQLLVSATQTPSASNLGINSSAPDVVSVEYVSIAPGTTTALLTAISAGSAEITATDELGQTSMLAATVAI